MLRLVLQLWLVPQAPLPTLRPAEPPPVVAQVGIESQGHGGVVVIDPSPAIALADLALYDADVRTAFPFTGPSYPTDSLTNARVMRARAWLTRESTVEQGPLWDPVLRGELEATALEDKLAQRTFAGVLVGIGMGLHTVDRRSYILSAATWAFTDVRWNDTIVARWLPLSESYFAKLLGLPHDGLPTVLDSFSLRQRVYSSASAVLRASVWVGDRRGVALRTDDVLTILRERYPFPQDDRYWMFNEDFPLESVALALLHEPTTIRPGDTVAAHIQRGLALTPREIASQPHLDAQGLAQHMVDRVGQAASLLDQPAPPLTAHAWLNTPDSIYQPVPRTHMLADGIIRIVFFTPEWRHNNDAFPTLGRVHAHMGSWGQVVVMTQTGGYAGTELVDPATEVAWTVNVLREQMHFTPIIGLWAGQKVPTTGNDSLPKPWPIDTSAYRGLLTLPQASAREGDMWGGYNAVVVDAHGLIRGFFRLTSHRDEVQVTEAVDYLHAEASGLADPPPRPSTIVPTGVQWMNKKTSTTP